MKMQSIEDLLLTGMSYVLDFEEKISKGAAKMADASTDPELKELFQKSVSKGHEYGQKVEQTFGKLGKSVERNENSIAQAMLGEVEGMIQNTDPSPVRDAALIVAANQMQLYRVAVYGSFETYAKLIGKQDAAEGMKQNLEDSKGGDEKLTKLGEQKINREAAHSVAA